MRARTGWLAFAMSWASTILLASIAFGVAASPSQAADESFLGAWTVSKSQAAPWTDAAEKPVASDLKALMGMTVTFRPDRIVAPKPLGCRGPHYETKPYAPDMLFQGALTDPARQAPTLGFAGGSIPTLETGCEGAIDFHFVDQGKAMFALNNRIYVLTRSNR